MRVSHTGGCVLPCLAFYVGAGALNAGLHVCMASQPFANGAISSLNALHLKSY